jgi:hypothetical protein
MLMRGDIFIVASRGGGAVCRRQDLCLPDILLLLAGGVL